MATTDPKEVRIGLPPDLLELFNGPVGLPGEPVVALLAGIYRALASMDAKLGALPAAAPASEPTTAAAAPSATKLTAT